MAYAIADAAGLRPGRRGVDRGAVQLHLRSRPDEVRLRHQPGLHHARARRSRSTSPRPTTRPRRRCWSARAPSTPAPRPSPSCPTPRSACRWGTTSLDAVNDVIKPSKQPRVYNDSNDMVRALKSGQVDAIVVDLPTAFFLTATPRSRAARSWASSRPPAVTTGAWCWEGLRAHPMRGRGDRPAPRLG